MNKYNVLTYTINNIQGLFSFVNALGVSINKDNITPLPVRIEFMLLINAYQLVNIIFNHYPQFWIIRWGESNTLKTDTSLILDMYNELCWIKQDLSVNHEHLIKNVI